jgi:hypothetical protein
MVLRSLWAATQQSNERKAWSLTLGSFAYKEREGQEPTNRTVFNVLQAWEGGVSDLNNTGRED